MGLFSKQFQNLIEWNETRDDVLFHLWKNREIKKDSKVIIRPGQDAIFMYNGVVEGIFEEEGQYEVHSQIIPFLTTLKSYKFGFSTPLRAEVLFVNTKEFLVKWGTKKPINIPQPGMPGGLPIRCFGTYSIKINDYSVLIDKVAGIKEEFTVDDVKERLGSKFDQYLMRAIIKEGRDMFNLQVNSIEIGNLLKEELTNELLKIGLEITEVSISNFNYPDNIQAMIEKNATYGMVGDMNRYRDVGMIDSVTNGSGIAGNIGRTGAGMAQAGMGMAMGMQMVRDMGESLNRNYNNNNNTQNYNNSNNATCICNKCNSSIPNNAKFCPVCGEKVEEIKNIKRFCTSCGTQLEGDVKFCSNCGNKL